MTTMQRPTPDPVVHEAAVNWLHLGAQRVPSQSHSALTEHVDTVAYMGHDGLQAPEVPSHRQLSSELQDVALRCKNLHCTWQLDEAA